VDWWQIVLIILAFIIVGLLVGRFLSYLIITRLLKKPFVEKHKTTAIVEEPVKYTVPDLFEVLIRERGAIEQQAKEQLKREAEEVRKAGGTKRRERKEAAVVKEPPKSTVPNLVAEVENNRRIATEPWTGKLLPFQTEVWDTNPDEIHTLPANFREDLTEAYTDIRLANSIVWLSTELGRRSHNLDENYMKLRANIAERLNRVKPLIERF